MDGVLVDFENDAIKIISGILAGSADPKWTSKSKSMKMNVGLAKSTLGESWRPTLKQDLEIKIVRQIMKSAIACAPGDFFASLPPLNDGITDLWPFLNSLELPVHILSAPINGHEGSGLTAEEGKRAWCSRHLNPAPQTVIIANAIDKQKWAMTGNIPNVLVDDKKSTIDAWNARGGLGILHEAGNSTRSIDELRRRLG